MKECDITYAHIVDNFNFNFNLNSKCSYLHRSKDGPDHYANMGTAVKSYNIVISIHVILKCDEYQKKPSCKIHVIASATLSLNYYILRRGKREVGNLELKN